MLALPLNLKDKTRRLRKISRTLALAGAMMGFFGSSALAGESVAVVGKWESASIVKNLRGTEADDVALVPFEEGLPSHDFSGFGLVILHMNVQQEYNVADSEVIKNYVTNGGRLLLICQAPKLLPVNEEGKDRQEDYLFGRSFYFRDGIQCEVLMPEDPLLKGVLSSNSSPHWLHADVLLNNPGFENLIGGRDHILVGRARHGKGMIYYVGHELFRMQLPTRPERHADAESWKTLLVNIIMDKPQPPDAP